MPRNLAGSITQALGALLAVALFASLAPAQPNASPQVKVTVVQSPEGSVHRDPVEIVVTVETSQPLTGAKLVLTSPPGIQLEAISQPASLVAPVKSRGTTLEFGLGSFAGRTSKAFMLVAKDTQLRRGSYRLLMDVYAADTAGQPRTVLAHDTILVAVAPQIAAPTYLILGLLGAIVGYLLRLVIKVLSTVPAPLPAPKEPQATTGSSPGPITRFVTRHYYLTDFLVTLVIVFFAMLALMKDAQPPESAVSWYGALGLGLGFGLLSNSELITKFRA